MLLLLALGVPEEIVKEDYLLSNVSRKEELDELMAKYSFLADQVGDVKSFLTMIEGVLPQSADMLISEILEKYGTYEKYMEAEYGFDEEKLTRFRDMYLE